MVGKIWRDFARDLGNVDATRSGLAGFSRVSRVRVRVRVMFSFSDRVGTVHPDVERVE